jgi:hypothetical protein
VDWIWILLAISWIAIFYVYQISNSNLKQLKQLALINDKIFSHLGLKETTLQLDPSQTRLSDFEEE